MATSEGDVLEIDMDAAVGHEQQGRRPVLVVSVNELHSALGLAIVCAITTRGGRTVRPRNELEIAVPPGLPVEGVILSQQLKTIDLKTRRAKPLGAVPRATLQLVRSRVKALLGV